MRFRNWSMFVCLLLFTMLAYGCRDRLSDPESLLPVRGTVLLNGRPLAGATVTFQAVGGEKLTQEVAAGTTDESGRYHLRTLCDGRICDGAGRGRYRVVISRLLSSDGGVYRPNPNEPPAMSGFSESLPSRYSDSMVTELTAVLSESSVNLDFSLSDTTDLNEVKR